MKLAPASLEWALKHIQRYSDTDKFPHPIEVDVIGRQWTTVRAHLEGIDLTNHRWSGDRKMLIPKDAVSFGNAAQLDPLDSVLLAALIYEVGHQIEVMRSPICHRTPECGHDGTAEKRPLRVGANRAFSLGTTREGAHGQLPEDESTPTGYRSS